MPDAVSHVQARHVRRCVVNAAGNLLDLAIAALNVQAAGRGDAIKPHVMGCRIVTAAGNFTISNPDSTGTLTILAAAVPYDIPATNGMADTVVNAVALGVEVYYTGSPTVP